MKKIVIIGCGGAGKSRLARRLGDMLDLPVIHLDALYWRPGWEITPRDEWTRTVEGLLEGESWIIDGNYSGTLDIRLPAADTVIFLDFPRALCMWRVILRFLKFHGRTRPDLAHDCPEKLGGEMLRWVWDYRRSRRPGVLERLSRLPKENVVILRKPREVERYLRSVRSQPVEVNA